jgi:tRNA-dihydrouridine synthase B
MNPVAQILAGNPVLLAPMAGVTDAPFRGICKRMGAGLTYTEMVSAKGLHYNPDSRGSKALLTFADNEVPCAVQLFGSEPELIAEQAAVVAHKYEGKVALVDINMGCPVQKVVGKGEGSALMRTPELASLIAEKTVERSPVPVTVKIRKGWDESQVNAVEFAKRMEAAGVSAVAVHGRTRDQFYRGQADWDVIAEVKQAVSIPVIGSGDVMSAGDAVEMLRRTGVDAVMVARGAQGNPWIFSQINELLAGAVSVTVPRAEERIAVALEHAREMRALFGDHSHARMRKHVAWYVHGMPGASHVRGRVNACACHEELEELLAEYLAYLDTLASE